jgi:hypothetical protein
VKAVALALALTWPLALPGPLDSGRYWGTFRNRTAGHQLRLPPGWQAYQVYGTTVVSSRPLANPGASPAGVELDRGDVYLRIDQTATRAYAGEEQERPDRFTKLPRAQGYDCGFGHGHALLFRDRGFHFHAFVRLRGGGGRTVLAVLNTVRVTK